MEVFITGIGAVSPIGMTARESFSAAVAGKSGISKPEQFSSEITQIFAAGQIKDFSPEPYVNKREAKRMARFTQMAIVAAAQAWEEAGLKPEDYDPERVGVVLGSGMGGLDVICEQYAELVNNGPRSVSSFFIPMAIVNTTAGLIAIRYGLNASCKRQRTMWIAAGHTRTLGDEDHRVVIFEALLEERLIIIRVCRCRLGQLFRAAEIVEQIALLEIGIVQIVGIVHTDIRRADCYAVLLHHFRSHIKGAVGRYANSFHHASPCIFRIFLRMLDVALIAL